MNELYFVWDVKPSVDLFWVNLHWYGLFQVMATFVGIVLAYRTLKLEIGEYEFWALVRYGIVGAFIGSRLFYCLVSEAQYYLAHPFEIFAFWNGGRSGFGALFGVLLALLLFGNRYKISSFLFLADKLCPIALSTYIFVRLGNLFNSENIGIATDGSWGIIYPAIDKVARHPVQIYEILFYSVLLLTFIKRSTGRTGKTPGLLFAFFLIVTYSGRFILEFFAAGSHSFVTEDQIFSLVLIFCGFLVLRLTNVNIFRIGMDNSEFSQKKTFSGTK